MADGTLESLRAENAALRARLAELESARLVHLTPPASAMEERYRGLFNAMQEGLLLAELIADGTDDPVDFRYLDMNPAAERMLGLTRDQIVGRTAREIIPDAREHILELYAQVVLTGEALCHEIFEPLLDQHHENFAFRPAPGQVAVLFWDITERKRTEDTLKQTAATLARERERLEVALRAGKLGVYEWRIGEPVVWWSPEVYPVYEVDPDTFVPTVEAFVSLVHPDDREELRQKTASCIEKREVFTHEYRTVLPDGEVRWIANRSHVGMGADGAVERIIGVAVDVTERRQADQALRESEERFRHLIQHSANILWRTRPDGTFIGRQESWERFTGQRYEEYQTLGGFHAIHPEDQENVALHWQRLLFDPAPFVAEYRLRHRGGEYRQVLSRGIPVRGSDGQVREWFGFIEDISERKRQEARVQQHVHEIEALNAHLRRAMAETHHRVKNNLQVITALVDMQTMTDAPMVPVPELARIGHHVRALAAIHDMLTEIAKLDGDSRFVSSTQVMDRLAPLLRAIVGGRTIRLHIEDVCLAMRQGTGLAVLVNELVSNAVKHGRGDIEISLSAVRERGVLTVSDDGPGFLTGFDPRRAMRTGLELVEAVVRHDLLGDVQYVNRPAGGASVVVDFPRADLIDTGRF